MQQLEDETLRNNYICKHPELEPNDKDLPFYKPFSVKEAFKADMGYYFFNTVKSSPTID
jgi:hypothetical protein